MESNLGEVIAVSLSMDHTFSKENQEKIKLVKGLGIEGDAHTLEQQLNTSIKWHKIQTNQI